MFKSFCGIGKIPKGHKRGNMKECVMAGQVRYYGIKKVDPRILASKQKLQKEDTRESLLIKIAGLRGRINKLKRGKDAIKISVAKKADLEKRKKFMDDIKKIRQKITEIQAKLRKVSKKKKLKKKTAKRKTSKKKKRKRKKKTRRKRTSRKKTSRKRTNKRRTSKKRKHKGGSCGRIHKKRKFSKSKRITKRKRRTNKIKSIKKKQRGKLRSVKKTKKKRKRKN